MRKLTGLFAIALMAFASVATAQNITNVSVEGIASWDLVGDTDNVILTVEVGSDTELTGVAWDVGIDPLGASWYSEASIDIGGGAVQLAPGAADGFATTGAPIFYDSGGIVSFAGAGLPNLVLSDSNGDGSNDFTIEFFDSFDDVTDDIDAFWLDGPGGANPSGLGGFDFETTAVPEPASAICFTMLGLGLVARRRRS